MKSADGILEKALLRATRTVLFTDVVESVRLMEQDENAFVAKWLDVVEGVRSGILPDHHGRLVKVLGDGMLMDFESPQSAVAAALAIRRFVGDRNAQPSAGPLLHLRMGIETSDVIVDPDDVYGRGVNRAARLMSLAGPDEICISAAVRHHVTADLDADIEDLGDCYLKHLEAPVRAYRLGPPSGTLADESRPAAGDLMPVLAVIPFSTRDASDGHNVLGELLAEELIRDFSQSAEFIVISRLSTTSFRGRDHTLQQIATALRASFVLSGTYHVTERQVSVEAQLTETEHGHIIWSGRHKASLDNLLSGRRELIDKIAMEVCAAVMSREIGRTRSQRLPTLQSYALLIAATALMHRLALADFTDARVLLEALIERSPRQAIPQALLGKWHVLRVQQGWSEDVELDALEARLWTRRALDVDPQCSLALAVEGFVFTNLLRQFDVAKDRYDQALQSNPNDSLAWLLRGTLHAFMGKGKQAVRDTRRALALSPLDPQRYFYDSLSATAFLSARQFEKALTSAKRSLRANRTHTSTLRALAVAQWNLGQKDAARNTIEELLRLEPSFTISRWLQRSPSAFFPIGEEWADTFREIGLPK